MSISVCYVRRASVCLFVFVVVFVACHGVHFQKPTNLFFIVPFVATAAAAAAAVGGDGDCGGGVAVFFLPFCGLCQIYIHEGQICCMCFPLNYFPSMEINFKRINAD